MIWKVTELRSAGREAAPLLAETDNVATHMDDCRRPNLSLTGYTFTMPFVENNNNYKDLFFTIY